MGEAKYVDVDGIKTRYFEGGTGVAMVLVHGGHSGSAASSAMEWMPIFPSLADHFHVYAVDMLGMGLTDKPGTNEEYAMQATVEHLHRFMETLGIDQVHLVGHSRGALPGARIAIDHPELVKTLTLFDSNTLAPGELPPPPAPGPRNRTRSRPGGFPPTAEDEEWIRRDTERVRQRLRSARSTFQEDFSALKSGRLKTPTLMIWGFNDPSGTSEPYRLGLELFEMISKSVDQAQLHFFNQARPAPYRDHPGEVTHLMVSFIGRVKD
jgi:2-hydroxy-6-oxo-6-(2'-carboxyphenyl)-hexa-2,4-dienoate hydrolase